MDLFPLLFVIPQFPGRVTQPHGKSYYHGTLNMQLQFLSRVISLQGGTRFFTRYNPPPVQAQSLPETLEMVTESGHLKRPMCPSCSKPTRFCLCARLKTPCIQNSVAVTILQHSLEKTHPLNSTRIASIGLQNLSVISVSDVNYGADFFIHFLSSSLEMGSQDLVKNSCYTFKPCDNHLTGFLRYREKDSNFDYNAGISSTIQKDGANLDNKARYSASFEPCVTGTTGFLGYRKKDSNFNYNSAISFTIEKYGAISSFQNQHFIEILASRAAIDDIRKGFLVKKVQRKAVDGSSEFQELEGFELAVPQGTVLLFPSENSIGMEEIDFEVKNLIILDGTWAKAKRMYNENPWLKVLPHVRLDVEKLSLYSEVRQQPKAGFLSTIESIVYALKAVDEEDSEGLDHLLDVFESMVGDQRRCKDERLRGLSNCD